MSATVRHHRSFGPTRSNGSNLARRENIDADSRPFQGPESHCNESCEGKYKSIEDKKRLKRWFSSFHLQNIYLRIYVYKLFRSEEHCRLNYMVSVLDLTLEMKSLNLLNQLIITHWVNLRWNCHARIYRRRKIINCTEKLWLPFSFEYIEWSHVVSRAACYTIIVISTWIQFQ